MGMDAAVHGLRAVSLSEGGEGRSRDGGAASAQGEAVAQGLDRSARMPGLRENLRRSRGSGGPVSNVVPHGRGLADPRMESAIDRSSGSSDDGDDCSEYESAGEQEEIDTVLSSEDAALFAEVTRVLREGGDLKKLRVDHLKAYLRHHGLRISGLKAVLLSRCEEHLRLKDAQPELLYPRSSFSINCKGDVCLGDTVLFLQNVYDSFRIVSRNAQPLGTRWVAGRVVNESYGAGKQQHTFTIEVLWSTGTRPFYLMRPLLIKGRNLYRMKTMRQPWSNEADRQKVLDEKHARGAEARAQRRAVTESSSRGPSRPRPSARSRSDTRDLRGESRSICPAFPSSHDSRQHERHHTRQINIHEGSFAAHSHTRIRPAESDRIPPSQNFIRHGWAHTEQQGRIHSEQRGGTYSENHVYQASLGALRTVVHVGCSTRGCEKAGAKLCISRSCASCCFRNVAIRGSCPRHQ